MKQPSSPDEPKVSVFLGTGKHSPQAEGTPSASSNIEDLLKSPDTEGDDEGITTFRSAYKALNQMHQESNATSTPDPYESVTATSPSKRKGAKAESDVLQTNPTYSIVSSYVSDPKVPLLIPGNKIRSSNRRPTHYIPSDVYTIESAAQYTPRKLHSNSIFYQKALSFLRDYKKVLLNRRPYGLTYRPNSYSDDPAHIRAAYEENTPVVVRKNSDAPLTPIQNSYPSAEERTRSSQYSSSHLPYSQLEPYQQHDLPNLPLRDIVPISNANRELVGYMPVIQIPGSTDPMYDSHHDYQRRPQMPSYTSLEPPYLTSDAEGLPHRDRQLPPGVKGEGRSGGKKKKRRGGGGQRSRYLSPSVKSRRRQRKQRRYHQQHSSYLTFAASSSPYHHATPYSSASPYPRSGINGQDKIFPLSSSSSSSTSSSSSVQTRSQYPAGKKERLVPILKMSFKNPAH